MPQAGSALAAAASVGALTVMGPDTVPRATDPGCEHATVGPVPLGWASSANPTQAVAVSYIGGHA